MSHVHPILCTYIFYKSVAHKIGLEDKRTEVPSFCMCLQFLGKVEDEKSDLKLKQLELNSAQEKSTSKKTENKRFTNFFL